MPDAQFDHPRLAATYDPLEGPRNDLDAYAAIVAELDRRRRLPGGRGA